MRTFEDDANCDPSYAFTDGWREGCKGRPMTEDDLIPWPQRLRASFKSGWVGGLEWAKARDAARVPKT